MFFNKSENQPEKEAEIELAKTSTVLPKAKVEEELQDFVEESEGQLAVDVYQTPTEIVIQSTVAGVDPENLDIAIEMNRYRSRPRERLSALRMTTIFIRNVIGVVLPVLSFCRKKLIRKSRGLFEKRRTLHPLAKLNREG